MKNQKKILNASLFMLFISFGFIQHANANCSISGVTLLAQNATTTYSITPSLGRSYFWSVTGNLSIIGANTGSSVTVRANSCGSGAVHVSSYGTGKAPCCSTRNITIPCNPPNCYINVNQVNLLLGVPNDITFTAPVALGPNTILSSATFQVFFANGTSEYLSGLPSVIPNNVVATHAVPCSNRVIKVIIRVNGLNTSTGETCFHSFTENYGYPGECGDNDGVGGVGGFRSSIIEINDPIDLNFGTQKGKLIITDMNGEINFSRNTNDKRSFGFSEMSKLSKGKIYVARFVLENGKIEIKKFVIK